MSSRLMRSCFSGLVAVSLLVLAACGNAAKPAGGGPGGEGNPLAGQRLRIIVPTSPGGGFDTTTRQLQPYLEKELDATVVVENLEGGGYAIGTQTAVNAGGDCKTILFHAVPHLTFSYLTQKVDYTLDDLAPIAKVSIEPGMYRVRDDAPWKSMKDLVADAKKRPNKIRLSVSDLTTSNFVAVKRLQELTGADFNVVPYDGGGPARNALVAGEVDVTEAGVFNSLSIDDGTRVLAVNQPENLWPEITDDAPTTKEALGQEVPSDASHYGLFAPKACADENPEAYQALVDAVASVVEDEDFLAKLKKLGEADKIDYSAPDQYGQLAQDSANEIKEILAKDSDAFKKAD